jgi:hypothetical protein
MMASEYQYLTTAEYASYDLSVSGITNVALAEQHISYAEKLIDAYCGAWPQFYSEDVGIPSAVLGATVTADLFGGGYGTNYFAKGGLYLYVYEGAGVGEERLITASDTAGTVTLLTAISSMDTTSKFILRQHSVFPRYKDIDATNVPLIPKRVKQAVAAQVAFGTQKGSEGAGMWHSDPVLNERADLTSESYGSGYSYSRDARRVQGPAQFIAPQAGMFLRGYIFRQGKVVRRDRGYLE